MRSKHKNTNQVRASWNFPNFQLGVVVNSEWRLRSYNGVNGMTGMGGSIDCAPPVIANGMLFVNSGYAQFGEKPGNMLLAFEVNR